MSSHSRIPGVSLHRLIAQAVATHEAVAARLGINATDLRCLGLIGGEESVTPTRLAELAGLTTGAITGVLDRLERAGFVRREPDPADRRRLTVRVEPARMGELSAYFEPLVARAAELTADWSPDARRALVRYLDGFTEALATEAERLRVATRGGIIGDTFAAPIGDATHGRLVVATGAPRLSWGAAALGQQVRMVAETAATRLYLAGGADAAFGDDRLVEATFDGPPPDVRAADGTVTIRYRGRLLDTRARAARIALTPAIPWSIEVDGGITDLEGDVRPIRLAGLQIRGGANHLTLRLPEPTGTVAVSLTGGASSIELLRPRGTAALVWIRGGASRVRFDDQRLDSVSGELRLQSDGYASAAGRYEFEIEGGASDLRVLTSN